MSLFLETIKINRGRRINLSGHSERMNASRNRHFHEIRNIDLEKHLQVPIEFRKGIVKCRVTYGRVIEKIEFEPYQFRNPRSFQLVNANHIDYGFKYADRKNLNDLYASREGADDILMVRNGLITDSFYANVALLKNGVWYTPQLPMLAGTFRKRLLDSKKLVEREISIDAVYQYEALKIFNALTEWGMHSPVILNERSVKGLRKDQ